MLGTAVLVLVGTGVVANVALPKTKGHNAGWGVISFGWGIGITAGVFAAYKSGGNINPAVTLGAFLDHPNAADGFAPGVTSSFGNMLLYWLAQVIGAIIGAVVCWVVYKKHFDQDADAATKLGVFATGPAIRSVWWNAAAEAVGTFVLVLVALASSQVTTVGLGPLLIGLTVVGIGMGLGGPTGFAINPARDLGPRIAHWFLPIPGKGGSDWAYAWVPVVGPLVGGALAGLVAHFYIG
ncbi:MAG: aquaporin family protein [Micrococcales bacterium]|nr:aquaporin family protein [Micrococcales bacterium]